jgi:predicted permease
MFWHRRKSKEEDLERELRSDLELEAEERRENGLSPEDARFAARRALGNTTLVKEEIREMRGWTFWERFWQDVRYALRVLRKNVVFSAAAVLSLALGIGANTAIFSLIDGLWMRPMAVPKSNEIVRLFSTTSQNPEDTFSYPEYLTLKDQARGFQGLVARGGRGTQIPNKDGTSELHTINVVSDNFFRVVGIQPLAGRVFTPDDKDLLNHEQVAVLGNSFWKRRFGSDRGIVGQQIEFQRGSQKVLFAVLGVLPETFRDINNGEDRDIWLPTQSWLRLSGTGDLQDRGFRWFRVLGRLRPGVSIRAANAQVELIARRLASEWPATNRGRNARVVSDLSYRLELAGTKGLILLSAVLLLVLLSSVNVANLLLARGAGRAREIAVRLSLGAYRWRVVRQLMTENVVLGFAGLLGGLGLGIALIRLLPSLLVQPPALQPELNFHLDSRVLGFSVLVSLATIFFFGLAPAWGTTKLSLVAALKERTAPADLTGRRLQPRHWLSISQISVSLVLLAGTGLMVRSFVNTRTLDYGISRKPLLDVWVWASGSQAPVLYREALESIREFPSAKKIAFASRAPLSLSEGGMSQLVTFPDRRETATQPVEIKYNSISSNYLNVMGTRLLSGRAFDQTDQTNGPAVVLISETMAHLFWGQENPIGKLVHLKSAGDHDYRIVGIVEDVPINAVGERREPYLYLPYWRNPTDRMTFVVETDGNPVSLAQPIRRKLISLSRELDPFMITTQQQLVAYSSGPYQMTAELVSTLGTLGLLLTVVGLYGVVSYGVTQRTREIGIRMALGADRSTILRFVLRELAALGILGLVLGIPLALLAARSASAMLFGVAPWDATTFCAAGALLALVLFVAGAIPARRAARIDPMVALRYE